MRKFVVLIIIRSKQTEKKTSLGTVKFWKEQKNWGALPRMRPRGYQPAFIHRKKQQMALKIRKARKRVKEYSRRQKQRFKNTQMERFTDNFCF